MKTIFTIAALGLASVISFGANAAHLVTNQQVMQENLQPVGTISISGVAGTPSDIHQRLSAKADQQGASAYRIIEARNDNSYHVTAKLYK